MRIGLGMAALGRPGYINLQRSTHLSSRTVDGMQRQANIVMDELFRQCKSTTDDDDDDDNIPWLDCARSYGLSEKFVGNYLRSNNIRPEEVYVSSKWGYTYVADWNVELGEGEPHEVKDHSLENFLKQVEETKAHIGPYLNLYQVHSATFESGILADTKVHQALHRCRVENGWKIGLSVSGPNQDELIREALKIHVVDEEGEEEKTQQQTATPQKNKSIRFRAMHLQHSGAASRTSADGSARRRDGRHHQGRVGQRTGVATSDAVGSLADDDGRQRRRRLLFAGPGGVGRNTRTAIPTASAFGCGDSRAVKVQFGRPLLFRRK